MPRANRTCDAPGCISPVQTGKLMCRPHWFATPKPLRDAISEAWKGRRIREWSAHCLEARRFHATPTPTPARVTPERSAELQRQLLGERSDA